jgi:hypothetical protein
MVRGKLKETWKFLSGRRIARPKARFDLSSYLKKYAMEELSSHIATSKSTELVFSKPEGQD